jgi:hypothetical protein
MFIKKIKSIFLNKNCHFLKKIVMQGTKFFYSSFRWYEGPLEMEEKNGGCHLKKLLMTS